MPVIAPVVPSCCASAMRSSCSPSVSVIKLYSCVSWLMRAWLIALVRSASICASAPDSPLADSSFLRSAFCRSKLSAAALASSPCMVSSSTFTLVTEFLSASIALACSTASLATSKAPSLSSLLRLYNKSLIFSCVAMRSSPLPTFAM